MIPPVKIESQLMMQVSDAFYNADMLFAEQALLYFDSIQDGLVQSVREKMREHTGAEKASVQSITVGGVNPRVLIFSNLIQASVDETGVPAGKLFPPFGRDSQLFQWVKDKLNPQPKPLTGKRKTKLNDGQRLENAQLSATFAVALNIYRRGLPAPNDPLRAPFATTFNENLERVQVGLSEVALKVSQLVNGTAT